MTTQGRTALCGKPGEHAPHVWAKDPAGPVPLVCSGRLAYGPGNPPPKFDPPEAADTGTLFYDEAVRLNNTLPGLTDNERLGLDLALHGNAYTVDGKRVPPESVVVHTADETCQGVDSPKVRTQDELLAELDELLDNALHDSHCFINEADTHCACVIGAIRAVLPPCGAVVPAPGKRPDVYWKCLRTAHPASPNNHWYGQD